ncbi:MAG: hypothetical protein D6695_09550 [Planctomycetota bacterium]|nr:MAG: hypothetical protein D6695_09550 [Planctomycetota bacterium]
MRPVLRFVAALLMVVFYPSVTTAFVEDGEDTDAFMPADRLVVRVQPGVWINAAQRRFGRVGYTAQSHACAELLSLWSVVSVRPAVQPANAELAHELGLDRYYLITLDQPSDIEPFAEQLRRLDALFESVEVVRPLHALCTDETESDGGDGIQIPNDVLFQEQWGLENFGQTIRGRVGVVDADIDATAAWQVTRGSPEVIVAVLDSGVSFSHPDLAGQVVQGRNFTGGDAEDVDDSSVSHGTHIAGIIAARWNNHTGISGIAPNCRVMPIRVVNQIGWTFEDWLAQGIIWAADHGASVMNISLGFPSASSLHRDAIAYAFQSDVVICASSGNIAGAPIGFPAALPETIAVGGTNNRDEVASFTSTGPELTLVAPGRDICSTWDTNANPDTYEFKSGTSFACPQVAAVAALIRSIRPDLRNDTVRGILAVTCDDLEEPGPDDHSGWGRLNARRALAVAAGFPAEADPTCSADLNNDGGIDFADLLIFLVAFDEGDPIADRNHDGQIDFHDMLRYLQEYVEGCSQTTYEP